MPQLRHVLTPLLTTEISSYFKNRPGIRIQWLRNRTGAQTDIFNLWIFDRQEVKCKNEFSFSPGEKIKNNHILIDRLTSIIHYPLQQ
jgi:hypothetical protein